MAKKLPFEGTTVAVSRSQALIKERLYAVGFKRIAEITDDQGESVLMAEYVSEGQAAQFKFEVSLETISGRIRARDRAARMAWRSVYYQVKSVCDSVELGIISISEAFGSQLLITDKAGNKVKVADFVAVGLDSKTLVSPDLFGKFLIEGPRK